MHTCSGMRRLFFCALALAGLLASLISFAGQPAAGPQGPPRALVLRIEAAISPASEDALESALAECEAKGFDILLVSLDTPGGLGESMRAMVKRILNAKVPVCVWVGPAGAHAASAVVFLVAAATVAGMAPQTTIGAASPVGIGGEDIAETMAEKVRSDIMGLVRTVAEAKGRNAAWYQKSVDQAVTASAEEALKLRVVDVLAPTPEAFLAQAAKQGLILTKRQDPAGPIELVAFEPGFRHDFLSWILHPQVAYFLLLGGMAGLFFELATPGAIFPGVFGGLCLLLALYALSVLPTNVAGLLLILFGLVLFGLEIKIASHGMLSVAAVICLFFGSTILFKPGSGFGELPLRTVIVTVLGLAAILAGAVYRVARARLSPAKTGNSAMLGLTGRVLDWQGANGRIRVRGEIWSARCDPARTLASGQTVRVRAVTGLVLEVEPAPEADANPKE